MVSEIKQLYGSLEAITITLASLASSTAGVGRQSTMVDNATTRFRLIHLFVKIKLGTSPNNNKTAQVYLIKGDDDALRTDNAGAADAALTVKNANLIGVLDTGGSAGTGDVLQKDFKIRDPGPEWGIAIVQDSGANLDAANHAVKYIGDNPETQ